MGLRIEESIEKGQTGPFEADIYQIYEGYSSEGDSTEGLPD